MAVLQPVLGDPLIPVASSLCGYGCHSRVMSAKIDLYPLVLIIPARRPCSSQRPLFRNVKSATFGSMVSVPFRRGRKLFVGDLTALHTEGFDTFSCILCINGYTLNITWILLKLQCINSIKSRQSVPPLSPPPALRWVKRGTMNCLISHSEVTRTNFGPVLLVVLYCSNHLFVTSAPHLRSTVSVLIYFIGCVLISLSYFGLFIPYNDRAKGLGIPKWTFAQSTLGSSRSRALDAKINKKDK